jgi:hypothetical protein
MQTKHCPDCSKEKIASDFARSSPRCVECARERKRIKGIAANARWLARNSDKNAARCKAYYAKNAEAQRVRAKTWRQSNAETHKQATIKWRLENAERYAAMKKQWRDSNAEHCAEYRKGKYEAETAREKTWCREWRRNNKDKVTAALAARTAAKLRATPPWADMAKIAEIYAAAARLTAETGIPHDVDHIYPLRSKWCCGLHVENNLQILTATENRSKSNRKPTDASALRECVY